MQTLEEGDVRAAIAAYAARAAGLVEPLTLRVAPFEGRAGERARGLERVEVAAEDGRGEPVCLLLKWTVRQEAEAMRAIAPLAANVGALSELVAWGDDEARPWVLVPLYAGAHPPTHDAVPGAVFDALAAVHHHWQGRTGALQAVETIDAAWWRRLCLGYTWPIVEALLRERGEPALQRVLDVLDETAEDTRVIKALERLPRTLLHGDMHARNVLVDGERVKIIDWGTARIGPALLDVANIAEHGSANEGRYLAARERLAGRAIPAEEVEVGYHWAQVQINTQYLAYVCEKRPVAELEAMLERRARELAALGRALRG